MIVDIVVLAVLLISAVIAFLRGFIREVLTIMGILGGLIAASLGGAHLSIYIQEWIGIEESTNPDLLFGILPHALVADSLAYGGIFIVVIIILSILSHILAEAVQNMGLGAIDRTFGVIFGIIRGVVLLGVLYLPVYLLVSDDAKTTWFEGSKTHIYLEKSSSVLSTFLPSKTVEKLYTDTQKIEEALGARKKLQDINVLRKEEEKEQKYKKDSTGYSDEFREEMDDLFKEKIQQLNE
ncbi:MAG: CvpA family protein [Alphaproteobacteria bacterium]|nr:CvpA family protein [Alphaproteobacteria bacterium]